MFFTKKIVLLATSSCYEIYAKKKVRNFSDFLRSAAFPNINSAAENPLSQYGQWVFIL